MNYGLIKKRDAISYAIAVCYAISDSAQDSVVRQLVETAAAETLLGDFKDPTPNSAGTGLTQVDFGTFEWLRTKFMSTPINQRLLDAFGLDLSKTVYQQLRFSPLVAMVFCRLRYLAVSAPVPDTLDGRAEYWKKYYNTSAGKGTPADYISKCQRCDVDALFNEYRHTGE